MRYAKLSDIANDLKDAMEALDVFEAVKVATITDKKLTLKAIGNLGKFPAAAVFVHTGRIHDIDGEVCRNVSAGIIIVDKFVANVERGSSSILDLLDQVMAAIEPETENGSDPKLLTCNGRSYLPAGFNAVALEDGLTAAYVVDIEVIE